MAEPILRRLWNAVKPPPAVKGPKKPMTAQRRKQRKIILATLGVLALGGVGWGIYAYIAAAPQRAQAKFDTTMLLLGSGKYKEAVDGFTDAIHTSPQIADAYVERGIANHFLKLDDAALADLDTAIQLNPSLSRAFNARGGIFRDRGDIKRAMEEYAKSIQAQPNVDAYFERGQIYERLGQHKEAIADYDSAVEYLRTAPHVYRARAFAKANLGDEEGAKADRALARSYEHR
jgi:tetratricopeptide (TPR) repeat protein